MNSEDLIAILPFLVMGAAATVIMLVVAFHRNQLLAASMSFVGMALALISLWPAATVAPRQVTPLFVIDGFGLFYMGLVLAASLVVVIFSYGYFVTSDQFTEEFYLLLMLATLGGMTLVVSDHFASFVLGLETLSISLLGLVAYPRDRPKPVEAGIKYLILAGASSAFLLLGMALIYARLGTLEFPRMAVALGAADGFRSDVFWLSGIALVFVGIGFKLSVVPFHMWAPDVYEGAPAPVTAYIAVVSKGAVFALLLRFFLTSNAYASVSSLIMINLVAIASMLIGNLLALRQNDIKRILAYSSIAHLGYLLVAFLAGGALAVEAVTYYLVAYFVMSLGAFGIVAALSAASSERELSAVEDYHGLVWRHPWLGGILTTMLLSLAGLPLTMGFFGKFYAITAGVSAAVWPAVIVLVVGSVIGLFYYLRIIAVLFRPLPTAGVIRAGRRPASVAALLALTIVLIWLGIYPNPLVDLIRASTLQVGASQAASR